MSDTKKTDLTDGGLRLNLLLLLLHIFIVKWK